MTGAPHQRRRALSSGQTGAGRPPAGRRAGGAPAVCRPPHGLPTGQLPLSKGARRLETSRTLVPLYCSCKGVGRGKGRGRRKGRGRGKGRRGGADPPFFERSLYISLKTDRNGIKTILTYY